jgi:hypothetical protein
MCVFTVGIFGFIVWDNLTLSCCGWRPVAAEHDQPPASAREGATSKLQAEGVPSH